MRAWGLAGLILVLGAPAAAASEGEEACRLDEQRRQRAEQTAQALPQSADTERAAPARAAQAERSSRAPTPRRRNGRRIPDAELIGPRGAL